MLLVILGTVIELEIQIPPMHNYLRPVNNQDIELLYNKLQQGNIDKSYTCSTKFSELTSMFMNENNLNEPTNAQEGLDLFTKLCQIFFHNEFKLVNFAETLIPL